MNRLTANAAAVVGLCLAATGIASAQADATATRAAEVNAFGSLLIQNPDYGQKYNFGYSGGVDYNRTSPGRMAPGLELRMMGASGNTVSERSVLGGFQFQTAPMFHAHPYMTALVGYGTISYAYNFTTRPSESDFVYALGAGADIPVRRNLKIRAEMLQQTWSYQPHNLTPVGLSIGIAYTVLGGSTQVH
ncbi:MAG: hypothetical protein M3O02_11630 [Acidobacteriota bacterium]|nr:hypothetical protein [Acidobacteriota bacterium]